jgi:hypothetical protein
MNRNKICFTVILIAPMLLLAGIALLVARDIREIRAVDPAEIRKNVTDYLAQRKPESFPFSGEILQQDGSRTTIFAFGASNLMLSDSGRTFPDYLAESHNDIRVVNLGVSGIDSFSIRQRVSEALSAARPDLILLYYGDNDYNSAYHNALLPAYFEKFDSLLRLPYVFYSTTGAYEWFARLNRPKLYKFFETLRLIRIDHTAFEPANQIILDYFILNNEAILKMASDRSIPVVLITPVGNLHAEPYGDTETSTFYGNGMAATDYLQSHVSLQKAIDTEIFTYDLRAKSPLFRYMRNTDYPNVHVLDLGRKLEEKRFGFGKDDFLDYVHFNDKSHRLVAGVIYDFLKQNNLIKPGRKSSNRSLRNF